MINICYSFEMLDDIRFGYIIFLHNWKNYFKYVWKLATENFNIKQALT